MAINKKNKGIFIVIGLGLLIMFMNQRTQQQAVIPDYVNANQPISITSELRVRADATSFSLVPYKVHWQTCPETDCQTIKTSGYYTLTQTQKNNLNAKLTDPVSKTVAVYFDITAPSTAGIYYYYAIVENSGGARVIEIDADSYANYFQSNKFTVLPSGVPCSDYVSDEIIQISHGTITVQVYHHMSGTEPNCVEDSTDDQGFTVLCDNGYQPNVNGRQSTCELIPSICTDTDGGKVYTTKGIVTTDDSQACSIQGGCPDECSQSTGDLIEYWCDTNNKVQFESYTCPNGCENGKCGGDCADPPASVNQYACRTRGTAASSVEQCHEGILGGDPYWTGVKVCTGYTGRTTPCTTSVARTSEILASQDCTSLTSKTCAQLGGTCKSQSCSSLNMNLISGASDCTNCCKPGIEPECTKDSDCTAFISKCNKTKQECEINMGSIILIFALVFAAKAMGGM